MLISNWKPDKISSVPVYRQIVNYIKEKISKGEWIIGTKLPTQRELADIFNVNRSTVVTALDELKAEGLIEGRGSSGTVIINNTWSLLASSPPPNWECYVKNGLYKPNLHTIQLINKLEFKKDIIRLSTGELAPELFPNKMMKEVLNRVSDRITSLGYEESKGSLYLRETISKYVKKFGINASPNSILIVSGSLQALQLISMGILQPGATVLVESPSYLKSLHIFQSSGMRLKGIAIDSEGIIISELLKNISSTSELLYTIPTFHNPTGVVLSQHKREEILRICEKKRLPLIEDDAYRELWIDKEPPPPIKAKDRNGIVLYMGTVSKSLAPGFRIGWLIGPEPIIERLGDIKMQTDYGASSLSQLAVAECISMGLYENYLTELRNSLKKRRDYALDILEKYFSDIASWNIPSGGFYIWLKLSRSISMDKLFNICSKNEILINPGNIYDFQDNCNIRISYSYASLSDLEFGLKKLSDIIRKL